MNNQLINRILMTAIGVLAFLGSIFLLILAWYIALPFLLVLFIISLFQANRYQWVKIVRKKTSAGRSTKQKDKIIDVEYEEIKK